MVSVPTAVYQGIRQYLLPDHDPVEVAVKIATVMESHRETVEVEPSAPSSPTPASSDAGAAPEGGAAPVIASDRAVQDMPATPTQRAHVRMGRTRDGKGRP